MSDRNKKVVNVNLMDGSAFRIECQSLYATGEWILKCRRLYLKWFDSSVERNSIVSNT